MSADRRDLYNKLRKEHPLFIYEDFSYSVNNNALTIIYEFRLSDKIIFRPTHRIPLSRDYKSDILTDHLLQNMIFNLGMVEMVSYWKAACSPKVIVKAGALNDDQIAWWKKLYFNGLGEFFYVNGIEPSDDFMEIEANIGTEFGKEKVEKQTDVVLVPIGGGKDSVVTLELLSKIKKCIPFIINPREANIQSVAMGGYGEEEVIKDFRSIDAGLLELNKQGFLNGHTPFSAMLAFTSVLVAYLYGIPEIALSNESSANEPTIPGTNINHQYSKSIAFENDFREYMHEYVTEDISYFSFLRPINELQIAKLFSGYPQHFNSFRSCNVGSKKNEWCGKCSKCLFTFIMLAPFVDYDELKRIFGKDMYEDLSLSPIFDQLNGRADEKPFECVGTLDEVNAALKVFMVINRRPKLQALLQHYAENMPQAPANNSKISSLMKEFGEHNLPNEAYVELLKKHLHDA